jgi:hypothetical protein
MRCRPSFFVTLALLSLQSAAFSQEAARARPLPEDAMEFTSYDIRDLLVAPLEPAPLSAVQGQSQGGVGLFGGPADADHTKAERLARITSLLDSIKACVAPDSWRDNGGSIGSIRELDGQLLVTQTRATHALVAKFLAGLREARNVQIQVDIRAVMVEDKTYKAIVKDAVVLSPEAAAAAAETLANPEAAMPVAVPHLLIPSGETVTFSLLKQQAYTSGVTVAAGGGHGESATATAQSTLTSGHQFQVTAAAGSDRKTVTLQLQHALSEAALNSGTSPTSPDKPATTRADFQTSLSLPSGATALIGGGRVPYGDSPVFMLYLVRATVLPSAAK